MRIIKNGEHRLFETDHETSKTVSQMLLDLEKNGLDAVRTYSEKLDDWNPPDFELSEKQIEESIDSLDHQKPSGNFSGVAELTCLPDRRKYW